MPVLQIFTNLSRDKIPADFLEKTTDFLAKLLEKDKKYKHLCKKHLEQIIGSTGAAASAVFVRVCVVPDAMMISSGEGGPSLISELIALDRFNKEQNKKYAAEIFAFYKEQLGIEYSRANVVFKDPGRENIGANGTTLAS